MTYKNIEYFDPTPGEMRCPFCDADVMPYDAKDYCQHYVVTWHDESEDDEVWIDLAIHNDTLVEFRELIETALTLADEYLSPPHPADAGERLEKAFGPDVFDWLFMRLSTRVAREFIYEVFEKSPNEYIEITADFSGGRPMSSVGTTILAPDHEVAAKDLTEAVLRPIPDLKRGVQFLREQLELRRRPRVIDPTSVAYAWPFSEGPASGTDDADEPSSTGHES